MNDQAWENLVDLIDVKYGSTDFGKRVEPLPDNTDLKQTVQFLEFSKGGERFRVERTTRPAVMDRKSHYHKGGSGGVRFENIYDESEVSHRIDFFRHEGGDWAPISPEQLQLG